VLPDPQSAKRGGVVGFCDRRACVYYIGFLKFLVNEKRVDCGFWA
jgi:hypothetical protein